MADASAAEDRIAEASTAEASPRMEPGSDAAVEGGQPDASGAAPPCPEGMVLVDTQFCPKAERKCLEEEYSRENHITICHRFKEEEPVCLVPQEHRRFCIDRYEYPNQKGAHPPWMVSWYDAQATCLSKGKRLCFESEWVAACEGPKKTPFPYGFVRDNEKCNIDNLWIEPRLRELYSRDPETANRELSRLDQSVASGARAECVSGFGVHDMTGNFDEWVTADQVHKDKSEWAGLKGGAWGHVRNACRPVTTSHPPDFTYYFIAFRCCSDPPGEAPYAPSGRAAAPEVQAADRAPIPKPLDPPGPSAKKAPRDTRGRP